jgi:type II secretory pathway pseudopilin PulG
MTLIELLVVIVILTTIVAAAIPIMAPAGDDRRLREASRGLNTFITGAQTRAIASGRPFGVALKRLGQDTNRAEDNGVCLEAFYVEQPAPYSGFDVNSRARVALYQPANSTWYDGLRPLVLIQFVTRDTGVAASEDGLPVGWDPDMFPDQTIRPGDVIEFGGTQYLLLADTADNDVKARFSNPPENTYFSNYTGRVGNSLQKAAQIVGMPINDTGQMVNITHDDYGADIATPTPDKEHTTFFTEPAPYKILRQPVPTSDEPHQLPEGAAIDLRASGVGINDYFYVRRMNDNSDGILIMFTPEGRVARVSYSQEPIGDEEEPPAFDRPVVENIYLLVGKRENAAPPQVDADPTLKSTSFNPAPNEEQMNKLRQPINWLSTTSRWIVIGSQSGRVVTVENAFVDPLAVIVASTQGINALSENSEELRNQQILAAREFTREMSQLGGR